MRTKDRTKPLRDAIPYLNEAESKMSCFFGSTVYADDSVPFGMDETRWFLRNNCRLCEFEKTLVRDNDAKVCLDGYGFYPRIDGSFQEMTIDPTPSQVASSIRAITSTMNNALRDLHERGRVNSILPGLIIEELYFIPYDNGKRKTIEDGIGHLLDRHKDAPFPRSSATGNERPSKDNLQRYIRISIEQYCDCLKLHLGWLAYNHSNESTLHRTVEKVLNISRF